MRVQAQGPNFKQVYTPFQSEIKKNTWYRINRTKVLQNNTKTEFAIVRLNVFELLLARFKKGYISKKTHILQAHFLTKKELADKLRTLSVPLTPPGNTPPGTTPPGTTPPGTTPPGTTPPGTTPPGTTPPGTTPPGNTPPGTTPPGTTSPGNTPPGTTPPGTTPPGTTPPGKPDNFSSTPYYDLKDDDKLRITTLGSDYAAKKHSQAQLEEFSKKFEEVFKDRELQKKYKNVEEGVALIHHSDCSLSYPLDCEIALRWMVLNQKITGYSKGNTLFSVYLTPQALFNQSNGTELLIDGIKLAQMNSYMSQIKFPPPKNDFSNSELECFNDLLKDFKTEHYQRAKNDTASTLTCHIKGGDYKATANVLNYLLQAKTIQAWTVKYSPTAYYIKLTDKDSVANVNKVTWNLDWNTCQTLQTEQVFKNANRMTLSLTTTFDPPEAKLAETVLLRINERKSAGSVAMSGTYHLVAVLKKLKEEKVIDDFTYYHNNFTIYPQAGDKAADFKRTNKQKLNLLKLAKLSEAEKKHVLEICELLNERTKAGPVVWEGVLKDGVFQQEMTAKVIGFFRLYRYCLDNFSECFFLYKAEDDTKIELKDYLELNNPEENQALLAFLRQFKDNGDRGPIEWKGFDTKPEPSTASIEFLDKLKAKKWIRDYKYVATENQFSISLGTTKIN